MKINLLDKPKIIMSNPSSRHGYFGWPSAIRLKNGDIAVGASGFRLDHVCPFGKAVLSVSSDEGETFSSPSAVIDTVLDDRDAGLCAFGESGLILTSFNNKIEFQRKWNESHYTGEKRDYINAYLDTVSEEQETEALGSTFRISYDNGKAFGELYKSPVTSPHGPIELADGSVLWVGCVFPSGDVRAYTVNTQSGDMEQIGEIDISTIRNDGRIPAEPYAAQLENGDIICQMRADGTAECRSPYALYQSVSHDGGKTWTAPRGINAGAPAHIIPHSSGCLISAFGYRADPFGIKVMFSHDNGESWSESEYIYVNPLGHYDLGYPSTVELEDGSLFTVFYAHHRSSPAVIIGQKWSFEN